MAGNPYQGQAGRSPKAKKHKGIKETIENTVADWFNSIPTGFNSKKGKLHTIEDATDDLRKYNKRKGAK